MKFNCKKCGNCCENRYLGIYFFEKNKLLKYKKQYNLNFKLIPFRYYFDLTNNLIIDIIYRVNTKPCPFFKSKCLIQANKFISCKKFPLNTCIDLGFLSILGFHRYYFDLDNSCSFIKDVPEFLTMMKDQKLRDIFSEEHAANLKDLESWTEIHEKIKYLRKNKGLNIVIDYKIKKRKESDYFKILDEWKHLDFNEYFHSFS